MSIGSQAGAGMRRLSEGAFEDAIIGASVALSATARREYPCEGDRVACRWFLEDYLPIISKVGWIAFGVSQPVNFRYRRLDSRKPGIAVRSTPEMLYDVVRCTAIHEAKLPDNLTFTQLPVIQTGNDGELVLPVDVICGLLVAIVASPKNANEHVDGDPVLSFSGNRIPINEVWGKRHEIEALIGIVAD